MDLIIPCLVAFAQNVTIDSQMHCGLVRAVDQTLP